MVDRHVNWHARDPQGKTFGMHAAVRGHDDLVRRWIQVVGPDGWHLTMRDGHSLGHAIAAGGSPDLLQAWCDAGGDARAMQDANGCSIGHAIISHARPEGATMRMMASWCAAGGDVHARHRGLGPSIGDMAMMYGNAEGFRAWIQHGGTMAPSMVSHMMGCCTEYRLHACISAWLECGGTPWAMTGASMHQTKLRHHLGQIADRGWDLRAVIARDLDHWMTTDQIAHGHRERLAQAMASPEGRSYVHRIISSIPDPVILGWCLVHSADPEQATAS
jgi:hypothetical protein